MGTQCELRREPAIGAGLPTPPNPRIEGLLFVSHPNVTTDQFKTRSTNSCPQGLTPLSFPIGLTMMTRVFHNRNRRRGIFPACPHFGKRSPTSEFVSSCHQIP